MKCYTNHWDHGAHREIDALCESFSTRDRRLVLYYYIDKGDDVASFDKIADFVTDRPDSQKDKHDVAASLYHVALPILEKRGLINYDERSGLIWYREVSLAEAMISILAEYDFSGSDSVPC